MELLSNMGFSQIMRTSLRHYFMLFIAMLCSLWLTGCSYFHAPPTKQERLDNIKQLIAKDGYAVNRRYETDLLEETWLHNDKTIEISMLAPKEPGDYPLIIYLPGLGEHANGGKFWREYWAASGYSVFSMQPLEIGDAFKELKPPHDKTDDTRRKGKTKPAKSAESDDMRYLGHHYFSATSLIKRINEVLWTWTQLKQRAKSDQSIFAKADFSRVIVAGYDLGAQTAAALIGENFDIERPTIQNFKPMAAIVFSPFADLALGRLTTRYRAIGVPLLAVTGGQDSDPYAIGSLSMRTAIWEYASPGDKYLLSINKADHRVLSGAGLLTWAEPGAAEKPGMSGFGGAMPGAAQQFQGGDRNKGGPPAGGGKGRGMRNDRPNTSFDAKDYAIALSLSTAFLDAVGKSDRIAKTWLTELAPDWLGQSAKLNIK